MTLRFEQTQLYCIVVVWMISPLCCLFYIQIQVGFTTSILVIITVDLVNMSGSSLLDLGHRVVGAWVAEWNSLSNQTV